MQTQVPPPPGRPAWPPRPRLRQAQANTLKTTTISDHQGRTLWSGALRPGRMHDQTALRTEGIAEQFHQHPGVKAEVDDGYRGLANEFPDQVFAPPKKPKTAKDPAERPLTEYYGRREHKRRQSSRRICVEHANAEVRQWRPLQRYTGRRVVVGRRVATRLQEPAARHPLRRGQNRQTPRDHHRTRPGQTLTSVVGDPNLDSRCQVAVGM